MAYRGHDRDPDNDRDHDHDRDPDNDRDHDRDHDPDRDHDRDRDHDPDRDHDRDQCFIPTVICRPQTIQSRNAVDTIWCRGELARRHIPYR